MLEFVAQQYEHARNGVQRDYVANPRMKCVGWVIYHVAATAVFPVACAVSAVACGVFTLISLQNDNFDTEKWFVRTVKFSASIFIVPGIQVILAARAFIGVFDPNYYYAFYKNYSPEVEKFVQIVMRYGNGQQREKILEKLKELTKNENQLIQLHEIGQKLASKSKEECKMYINELAIGFGVCPPGVASNLTRIHQRLYIPQCVNDFLYYFDQRFKREILIQTMCDLRNELTPFQREHQTNTLNGFIKTVGDQIKIDTKAAKQDSIAGNFESLKASILRRYDTYNTLDNKVNLLKDIVNVEGNEELQTNIQVRLFGLNEEEYDLKKYLDQNEKGLYKYLNQDAAKELLKLLLKLP